MNLLFYSIIKALNAAATKIFVNVARAQRITRQCLRDCIFSPHIYAFVLKLRESLLKSLKITLKKMVKFILRFRKTINSPKNLGL